MTLPSKPTYLYHGWVAAISIATRLRTAFGRIISLYSADWASNNSVDGTETTRTLPPWATNFLAASTAKLISEPDAKRMVSKSVPDS